MQAKLQVVDSKDQFELVREMDRNMRGVLVAQVRRNVCNRGSAAPRLVSLMLLIVITVALNHSEAFLQPKSSPTSALSISTIQLEGSPLPVRSFVVGSDQIDSGSFKNAAGQEPDRYHLNHNNSDSHVAPMEASIQQQQLGESSQSKTSQNEAAIQISYRKPHSRDGVSDLSTGTTDFLDSKNNNEELIINETNLEDLGPQLEAAAPPAMEDGNARMQEAVIGGPAETIATEIAKESELLYQGEQNLIGRRFGLFKKAHQTSNNNLPYSNLPSVPPYNDYCDRCLSSSSSGLNGAIWKIEPTIRQQQQQPYIYPLIAHYEAPIINPFGSFKSKLSKLHFSKPLKGDSNHGQKYQTSNIYRTPISSRIPFRAHHQFMQSHHFNCMVPTLAGNFGESRSTSIAAIQNQGSMCDPKTSHHLSYSNNAQY